MTCRTTDVRNRLNDSIIYSIVSAGDQAAICSHLYLAALNKKSRRLVDSKYLYADCDIDFSLDKYELYEHEINPVNKVHLIKSIVFQKKRKKSLNEEENIDHKEVQRSYLMISPTGKIISTKK